MAPRNAPTPGGDINPYDFLSLIAGLAAGQSKPTQAGINRLFMPEVGALTGTYFGDFGQTSDQQEAATMLQLAPDVLRASELLQADPTDIRGIIASKIVYEKMPVWEVKKLIRKYVLDAESAGEPDINVDATTNELMQFADKIQNQADALAANQAAGLAKPKSDVFSQAGLPSPDEMFSPEALAPDYFKMYAQETAKRNEAFRKIQPTNPTARRQAAKYLEEQQAIRNKAGKPMGGGEAIGSLFRGAGALFGGADADEAMKRRVGQAQDAEGVRFGNIAQRIVDAGPENKELSKQRAGLMREQQIADKVRDMVAAGLSEKAQQAGYTPLMVALLKRAQFGQTGG